MVLGRNGFGPKMTNDRQMASDTFIVKFYSVSGFRRHSSDNGRIGDVIFARLNS